MRVSENHQHTIPRKNVLSTTRAGEHLSKTFELQNSKSCCLQGNQVVD